MFIKNNKMLNLSIEEVKKIVKKYLHKKCDVVVPLYKEILVDTETPVSLFLKLAVDEEYAYLLESAQTSLHWGRYSFISFSPAKLIKIDSIRESILPRLRQELNKYYVPQELVKNLPRFFGGFVGYLSYELVHEIEPKVKRPKKTYLCSFPEIFFMFNSVTIIFDHFLNKLKIVNLVISDKIENIDELYRFSEEKIDLLINKVFQKKLNEKSLKYKKSNEKNLIKEYYSNISRKNFIKKIKKAIEYIKKGDVIQTVISRKLMKKTSADTFDIYRSLRIINPSPYMFYLKFSDMCLIGSSPEILIRKEGNIVETKPIAGTRPRSADEIKDKNYEKELINSEKENAEHIMLVDLARNDLGKISEYKTIFLPELKVIERFSHVMHIVTSVKGVLRKKYDSIDVLSAAFPAGTVSGAPKVRAMQIISQLEEYVRGPYAGAVGYFSLTGNMDMAITIRTIVYKDKKVFIQSGAGIVADSIPEKEYDETLNKAKALMIAIKMAEVKIKE